MIETIKRAWRRRWFAKELKRALQSCNVRTVREFAVSIQHIGPRFSPSEAESLRKFGVYLFDNAELLIDAQATVKVEWDEN